MNLLKIILISLILYIPLLGQNNRINIKIVGIEEIAGQMAIALFNNAENFPKQKGDHLHAFVKVTSDTCEYTFNNIQNGEYAVAVYHDKNSNGVMDKNFLGIPTEDYVFSNYAAGTFGPPTFKEAAFEFKDSLLIILDINK